MAGSFPDFWDRMTKANDALSCPDIRCSLLVKELKRLLELSYNEGYAKAEESVSLFESLFGKK